MSHLSKSKYVKLWQCPKLYYLACKKPELSSIDESTEKRMQTGTSVGELARGLFGEYVDVTVKDGDNLNYNAMISNTKAEIEKGTSNICEAAFNYDGCYCAVDILRKEKDGYAIYEVKSATEIKDYYYPDVAYQKYVLKKSGIKVTGTYLVIVNNRYVRKGDLNIKKLFKIIDVSNDIKEEEKKVPENIKKADKIYASANEPEKLIDIDCGKPYECEFWEYCAKDVPEHSVFDLYRMRTKRKYELYKNGIVTYKDIEDKKVRLNAKQARQVDHCLHKREMHVDKKGIKEFLSTLSYPLYFLDFETMQPAIPEYDNTCPYQQIPFQYSLHYIEKKNGMLKHKEFLAYPNENPLRSIAESLCENIPMNVCVTAYNKKFECERLQELADMFPDLSKHLLNIKNNIKDFLVPFQSGYMYNKEMEGSFSIKSVLPALFPNDPSLDYHNLKGCIHNGGEAMEIYPQMKYMTKKEQAEIRESLLRYCELDTYAMVKVWEKLKEAVI